MGVAGAAACLSRKKESLTVSPLLCPVTSFAVVPPLATVRVTFASPVFMTIFELSVNIDKS